MSIHMWAVDYGEKLVHRRKWNQEGVKVLILIVILTLRSVIGFYCCSNVLIQLIHCIHNDL
jgi:hypothetical protein